MHYNSDQPSVWALFYLRTVLVRWLLESGPLLVRRTQLVLCPAVVHLVTARWLSCGETLGLIWLIIKSYITVYGIFL